MEANASRYHGKAPDGTHPSELVVRATLDGLKNMRTPAEVAAVARAFGAGYVRQPVRPDGGYAVDHSANTYVVGPDGRLAAILAPGATPDQVLAAARKLL